MLITVGIYRPHWYRGNNAVYSSLKLSVPTIRDLKQQGYSELLPVQQCCLGFLALRMGGVD